MHGDHNPQTLFNTIVFQVGLFLGVGMNTDVQDIFPRRSMQLYEAPGDRAYLVY